jgi:hypothetical protein
LRTISQQGGTSLEQSCRSRIIGSRQETLGPAIVRIFNSKKSTFVFLFYFCYSRNFFVKVCSIERSRWWNIRRAGRYLQQVKNSCFLFYYHNFVQSN